MIIAMASTRNWYYYLEVSLYSIIENNDIKKVYLFLEDNNVDNFNKIKEIYDLDIIIYNYKDIINKYIDKDNMNRHNIYTDAALIRLFFSKVIKEDKVIYIDTDTITLGDISYLYNLDITNYYLIGVEDKTIHGFMDYMIINNLPDKCINSGVIVMNLKKIKEDKKDNEFIKLLNSNKYRFPDQDILNIVCNNKILHVDSKFNTLSSNKIDSNTLIIHYATPKINWIKDFPNSNYWYEYEERYQDLFKNNKSKEKIIDVIICAYNNDKYNDKAIKSILEQTIIDNIKLSIIIDKCNNLISGNTCKNEQE